jgi:hypothetical protein
MSTKSKWLRNILEFYDSATAERVLPLAPVVFLDDFLGYQARTSETGSTGTWLTIDVGDATQALKADEPNGAFELALAATSEAEDAVLYWGDQRGLDLGNSASIEFRVDMAVLPTTGVAAVFGVVTDHNLDKDTVAVNAWFRLQASGAILVETDDTTNDNDDTATGITAVPGTYNIFRIDFHDLSDVKFYIDGNRVASSTTFDMSNLTSAEQVVQPYMSLDKASGTGVGTMVIDYVRAWSNRS